MCCVCLCDAKESRCGRHTDEETYQSARGEIYFEAKPSVRLKGVTDLVPIYMVSANRHRTTCLARNTKLTHRQPTMERSALANDVKARKLLGQENSTTRRGASTSLHKVRLNAREQQKRKTEVGGRRMSQSLQLTTLAGRERSVFEADCRCVARSLSLCFCG